MYRLGYFPNLSSHPRIAGSSLIVIQRRGLELSSLRAIALVQTAQHDLVSAHTTTDFKKTGHPVRSGVLKLEIGRLVVGRVTTSEPQLLYVSFFCFDRKRSNMRGIAPILLEKQRNGIKAACSIQEVNLADPEAARLSA